MAAAISAAGNGRRAVICERLSQPGRKILATGGGRSNLLHETISPDIFTTTNKALPPAVFERFGVAKLKDFFRDLGLELMNDGGRIYPVTNQAASVLKVLEIELKRLGIVVESNFEVEEVVPGSGAFQVRAGDGRVVEAPAVILAGGGRSYPALGSNGSCYALAERLGHHVVVPVPSAVPLLVKDSLCHALQGQKMKVRVKAVIDGKTASTADGDLLFTQYGLSGTAVIDVSEVLSLAMNRQHRTGTEIVVDLAPFLPRAELVDKLRERMKAGWQAGDLLSGLLPEKAARAFGALVSRTGAGRSMGAETLADSLKNRSFHVYGTRGWNEAEFTSGGVDAREVQVGSLGSKHRAGIYFAGEVLDVQGPRGGYNLAWAWASGLLAGLTE